MWCLSIHLRSPPHCQQTWWRKSHGLRWQPQLMLATSKQLPPPVVRHSLGFLASGWTVATKRLEAAHGQRPACAASTAGSFARLLDFVPFVVLVLSILERMQCVPAVERSRLQTSQNSRCSFRTWASRFAHVLMHLAPNHTIDSDHQGQTRTPTAPLLQRFQMIQRATPGLLWAHSRCPVHDNATMTACTLFIARWPVHAGHAKKCLGRVGKPRHPRT